MYLTAFIIVGGIIFSGTVFPLRTVFSYGYPLKFRG